MKRTLLCLGTLAFLLMFTGKLLSAQSPNIVLILTDIQNRVFFDIMVEAVE